MITWSDVLARFPSDAALAAIDPDVAGAAWAELANGLSASYFGGEDGQKYKTARILYAAHCALAGGGTGGSGNQAAGPVIAESEGGVSRSYAVTQTSLGGGHGTTSYGQLFDALVRSSPRRIGLSS
jgi:hypothetical protein